MISNVTEPLVRLKPLRGQPCFPFGEIRVGYPQVPSGTWGLQTLNAHWGGIIGRAASASACPTIAEGNLRVGHEAQGK